MKLRKIFSILSFITLTFFLYMTLYRPLPKRTGSIKLSILESEVRVIYDDYGIPHIEGANESDTIKALGFTIAQDRLFQWEIQRRLANGSLSEVFGEKTLEIDKFNRNLGFKHYASKMISEKRFSDITISRAQDFIDGINYFIENRTLPLELQILRIKPKAFKLEDVIAFMGYMSYSFQEAMKVDPLISNLSAQLSHDQILDLKNSYETDSPAIDQSTNKSFAKAISDSTQKVAINFDLMRRVEELTQNFSPSLRGSNSWVVSGKKSTTAYPILVNDPHIGYSNPSIWYEAHIKYPGNEIYGHYLSFLPFPVLAHTLHHAWALTMSVVDDIDLYVEQRKNMQVKNFDQDWVNLKRRIEKIKIKDKAQAEIIEIYTSPNGPILDYVLPSEKEFPIAMKWSFYHESNKALDGLYEMSRAKNINEFKTALSKIAAPGLNISYADNSGNIYWAAVGLIPKRQNNIDGNSLMYGFNPAYKYESYLPFNFNPSLINPESNYIITANHIVSNRRRSEIQGYWQPSDRAREINKIITSKEKWSPDEMEKIFSNNKVHFWDEAKKVLLPSILRSNLKEKDSIYAYLSNWDGYANKDSVEMSLYRVWEREISKLAFMDEMGLDYYKEAFKSPIRYNLFKTELFKANSSWWNNVSTNELETREQILQQALQDTYDFLNEKFGPHMDTWKWGKLHTLEFVHPLGRAKPLDKIFNIGPVEIGGGYSIINAQGAKKSMDSYNVSFGPSTRRVVDLSNTRLSKGIIPTGNSGHILDKHYKDQLPLFLEGKLREQIMDIRYLEDKGYKALSLYP